MYLEHEVELGSHRVYPNSIRAHWRIENKYNGIPLIIPGYLEIFIELTWRNNSTGK